MKTDIENIAERINEARQKYKPEHVNLLLVAEAPPSSLDRFFYYEDVKDKDFLFVELSKVLCKTDNVAFIRSNKVKILQTMKDAGIYLMDLSDVPLTEDGCYDTYARRDLKRRFLDKIEKEYAIDRANTVIVLIKVTVFDYLYKDLKKAGYNVCNERIPFPSSGQQANFRAAMSKVIESMK